MASRGRVSAARCRRCVPEWRGRLDEYWKAFADDTRRLGQLELYRSGDFEKLAPTRGAWVLGVPALVLWGENDPFATAAMAERFTRTYRAPSSCCSTARVTSSGTSAAALKQRAAGLPRAAAASELNDHLAGVPP